MTGVGMSDTSSLVTTPNDSLVNSITPEKKNRPCAYDHARAGTTRDAFKTVGEEEGRGGACIATGRMWSAGLGPKLLGT